MLELLSFVWYLAGIGAALSVLAGSAYIVAMLSYLTLVAYGECKAELSKLKTDKGDTE